MRTKDFILNKAKEKGEIRSSHVVRGLGITRQTAAQHFRELVAEKKLVKLGTTLDARYVPFGSPQVEKIAPAIFFKITSRLRGLDEDRLFERAALKLNLQKKLSEKTFRIIQYAFTEMVNNAIDHSRAVSVTVEIHLMGGEALFKVRDKGIGAFESVRKRFHLKDHYEALEHLMKGKQTTDPKRHSGQGIFFTSKAADLFCLRSARLKWVVDNLKEDVFVEENKSCRIGTEVTFRIRCYASRNLKTIFEAFSNEDYEFDKSKILVRLSPKQGDYVSRSEAKRLLFGLEKFKRITFDFRKVKSIGQGFADEIFRVFKTQNPSILIVPQNMGPAVKFMVGRAQKDAALQ